MWPESLRQHHPSPQQQKTNRNLLVIGRRTTPVKKAKTVNMKKGRKEGRGGLAGHLQPNTREPRRPEGVILGPHHPKGITLL
jgi:hypothetical protein